MTVAEREMEDQIKYKGVKQCKKKVREKETKDGRWKEIQELGKRKGREIQGEEHEEQKKKTKRHTNRQRNRQI